MRVAMLALVLTITGCAETYDLTCADFTETTYSGGSDFRWYFPAEYQDPEKISVWKCVDDGCGEADSSIMTDEERLYIVAACGVQPETTFDVSVYGG